MTNVSDLPSHTGYVLRMVSNAVSHSFAKRLANEGVTVAEWAMMRSIYDLEAIAPSVLAARMGLTKGAITKLAERLLRKGLVQRAANPEDGRGYSLSLSDEGKRAVPTLAALADRNDAEFFDLLGGDIGQLRALLQRLVDAHGLKTVPVE